jgi:S-adenosylmethionine hydrolase
MIFAYTDFHHLGPYRGEMEAAVKRIAKAPFTHLMHDAPAFDPSAAGRLLAALARRFQSGDICIAVIDPGVGGARRPIARHVGGVWYVGPDNGLLSLLPDNRDREQWWEITWQPEELSTSFHGRDLFAPFAAHLADGQSPTAIGARPLHDPVVLPPVRERIIYIDGYGNAVTGIEAGALTEDDHLKVGDQSLPYAFTFDSVPRGQAFWYINSMNLVEIAVNQSNAAAHLGLNIGSEIQIQKQ